MRRFHGIYVDHQMDVGDTDGGDMSAFVAWLGMHSPTSPPIRSLAHHHPKTNTGARLPSANSSHEFRGFLQPPKNTLNGHGTADPLETGCHSGRPRTGESRHAAQAYKTDRRCPKRHPEIIAAINASLW